MPIIKPRVKSIKTFKRICNRCDKSFRGDGGKNKICFDCKIVSKCLGMISRYNFYRDKGSKIGIKTQQNYEKCLKILKDRGVKC